MFRPLVAVSLAPALTLGMLGAITVHHSRLKQQQPVTMANNWKLTPVGSQILLPGDMPGTILMLPDGHHALVNTCGYNRHTLSVVDLDSLKVDSSVDVGQAWVGLALGQGGNIFLSGASGTPYKVKKRINRTDLDMPTMNDRAPLLQLHLNGDQVEPGVGLPIPGDEAATQFVTGITAEPDGSLIVLDSQNNQVYRLSPDGKEMLAHVTVGYRPYACAESPDHKTLAVSNWGDQSVTLLNPSSLQPMQTIKVGKRPNAVAYAPDGRLFVSNAGSNAVYVIQEAKVTEIIKTSLKPNDILGTTPEAMTISPDGKTLYVANADNNDVAVIDIAEANESSISGFIPTGHYPCSLAMTPDGKRLIIGTAKGLSTHPSAPADIALADANAARYDKKYHYVLSMFEGHLSVVNVPSATELEKYSVMCELNRPQGGQQDYTAKAKTQALQGFKHIKHVIYIIKENRTYDQVFGDIKKGNGDPNLVMFGEKVTPNIHSLANTFSLLDNTYTDGETSQVGHQWTDGAYCGDYTTREMIMNYSGRQEIRSDARLFTSPNGYIWQDAKKHGKSTRIFGEYIQWQEDHTHAHGVIAEDPEKYGCSAAFEKIFARGGRDTEKAQEFLDEMHAAEKTGKWPNFMVMALNEDHTRGMNPGAYSPAAMIASNDQAVGMVIDGLSHSRFWKDTAVFIIEDDSQDGPDHVDAQRTEALVISPYVKRGIVDSTHYTTSSLLRTIELILGLPPMSQYDEFATPMYNSFTNTPDFTPYNLLAPETDLNEMNPSGTALARRSLALDWSDIDRADPDKLNEILWEAYKPGQIMPPPVHGVH